MKGNTSIYIILREGPSLDCLPLPPSLSSPLSWPFSLSPPPRPPSSPPPAPYLFLSRRRGRRAAGGMHGGVRVRVRVRARARVCVRVRVGSWRGVRTHTSFVEISIEAAPLRGMAKGGLRLTRTHTHSSSPPLPLPLPPSPSHPPSRSRSPSPSPSPPFPGRRRIGGGMATPASRTAARFSASKLVSASLDA